MMQMDDRNWRGDTEAQVASGSARRKKMHSNEGGNMTVETANYQVQDDFKDGDVSPYVNTGNIEESHMRSLVKGLTWRCLASATTITISWYITGEVAQALQIGFVEFFAKLAIYYAHERVWTKIRI